MVILSGVLYGGLPNSWPRVIVDGDPLSSVSGETRTGGEVRSTSCQRKHFTVTVWTSKAKDLCTRNEWTRSTNVPSGHQSDSIPVPDLSFYWGGGRVPEHSQLDDISTLFQASDINPTHFVSPVPIDTVSFVSGPVNRRGLPFF